MEPSSPQTCLNRVFITITGNKDVKVLTEGHVLVAESGHTGGVEAERVHNIVGDVGLLQDLEVVVDHVVDLFELGALDEEGEEEEAIFLEAVMGLVKEFILISVVEEALDIYHIVDGKTRHRLGKALNIGYNKVAVDMASMGPVRFAELNIAARLVNTDGVSGSHQLSKVVQAATSAAPSLKKSLPLEVFDAALF